MISKVALIMTCMGAFIFTSFNVKATPYLFEIEGEITHSDYYGFYGYDPYFALGDPFRLSFLFDIDSGDVIGSYLTINTYTNPSDGYGGIGFDNDTFTSSGSTIDRMYLQSNTFYPDLDNLQLCFHLVYCDYSCELVSETGDVNPDFDFDPSFADILWIGALSDTYSYWEYDGPVHSINLSPIPEPSTVLLVSFGLIVLIGITMKGRFRDRRLFFIKQIIR